MSMKLFYYCNFIFICVAIFFFSTVLYSQSPLLVKDIRSGATHSDPQELVNVNGTIFFSAIDGINGTSSSITQTLDPSDFNPRGKGPDLWDLLIDAVVTICISRKRSWCVSTSFACLTFLLHFNTCMIFFISICSILLLCIRIYLLMNIF